MTITRILVAALAIGALVVPAASAKPVDIHEGLPAVPVTNAPGATAVDSATDGTVQDVRSPQVFTDRQRATVERYKRSPSYQQALREAATVVNPPEPAPVGSDGGIDWGDAGIGAGGVLGVIALGLAGAMTILHRRRRGRRTATVA